MGKKFDIGERADVKPTEYYQTYITLFFMEKYAGCYRYIFVAINSNKKIDIKNMRQLVS
jgi:hypothetical protein